MDRSVSLIVMTLNAEMYIKHQLDKILRQTVVPNEIIIADSESTDSTIRIINSYMKRYNFIRYLKIIKNEFDHGGSRDIAFAQTTGDFVLFMTQDALPVNEYYIESLIKPLIDDRIAGVFGRQVAYPDASPYERLVREFNYSSASYVWGKEDIERLGVKSYFFSDACSVYRRTAYYEVEGFDHPIVTNEDMMIAAKLIHAGYHLAYEATAEVFHSHNMTLKQEYLRNILIGRVMKEYKGRLLGSNSSKEGIKMVQYVLLNLLKKGDILSALKFCFSVCAKYSGNIVGKCQAK